MESEGINIPKCARVDLAEKLINIPTIIKINNLFILNSSLQNSIAIWAVSTVPLSPKKATKIVWPDSYPGKRPSWPLFLALILFLLPFDL
jgi:hypothetical protein